jgi:hypothetical protein
LNSFVQFLALPATCDPARPFAPLPGYLLASLGTFDRSPARSSAKGPACGKNYLLAIFDDAVVRFASES